MFLVIGFFIMLIIGYFVSLPFLIFFGVLFAIIGIIAIPGNLKGGLEGVAHTAILYLVIFFIIAGTLGHIISMIPGNFLK